MKDWLDDIVREEGPVMFSDHPASEHLVLYAEAPAELAAQAHRDIEAHLRVCADCADDLARLEAAAAELRAGPRPAPTSGLLARLAGWLAPRRLVPVAALAVAVVALLRPWADETAVAPVGRAVVLRAEAERGAAVVATPDAEGRLALSFVLPGTGDGAVARCDVSLVDAEGRVVAEIPGVPAFDAYGTFVLSVEAGRLADGAYALVARDRLGERRFAFTLRRSPDRK